MLSFFGGLEYVREKPIDLTWQNSIYANLYGGVVKENRIEETFTSPALLLDMSQKWGYYPNTRTSATLLYGMQFTRVFDEVSSNDSPINYEKGISGIKTFTDFNISYFVSPRMQVSGYYSLHYIWQNSESDMNINYFFRPNDILSNSLPFSVGRVNVGDFFNNFGVSVKYSLF